MKSLRCLVLPISLILQSASWADIPTLPGIEPTLLSSGSVNVITGDYCEATTDITIRCAEPISLTRYHISSEVDGQIRGMWHLFREEVIAEDEEEGLRVYLHESDGTVLSFSFDATDKAYICSDRFVTKKVGVNQRAIAMVPGDGEGSWGRRLDKLRYDGGRGFVLERGNRERRVYRKATRVASWPFHRAQQTDCLNQDRVFLLEEVTRPNGNKVCYVYDDRNQLTKVYSTDPSGDIVFGAIELSYQGSQITAIGSDGQTISYDYGMHWLPRKPPQKRFPIYLLLRVTLPGSVEQNYRYDLKVKDDYLPYSLLQSSKARAYLKIGYWSKGRNCWGMHTVKLGEGDFQLGRVRCQSEPIGVRGAETPTHSYFYFRSEQGGYTDVVDAHKNCVTHYYTDSGRIDAIKRSKGYERYWWDGDTGCLKAKGDFGPDGRRGYYATVHRMALGDRFRPAWIQETWGNHTGKAKGYLSAQKDMCVNHGLEIFRTTLTFEDDSVLPVVAEDDWTAIHYTYKRGTGLPISKLTYEKTASGPCLRQREFYDYQNGFLVKQTTDNGCSVAAGDFTGVSEWSATEICLNDRCLPYILDHRDLQGLSSREVLHYDDRNLVVQKDIYDAEEHFVYSLYWDYDEAGRVIRETDPLGDDCCYSYNDLGLVASVTKGDVLTSYTYDRAGRCIESSLTSLTGEGFTEGFSYDVLGNLSSSVDRFGRETSYEYDSQGNLEKARFPSVRTSKGVWKKPSLTRRYNELGHLIEEVGVDGLTTCYQRTSRGDPYHITYADGNEEWFEYNLRGDLLKYVMKTGAYIVYERGYLGREISASTYSPDGKLLSQTHSAYEGSRRIAFVDGEGVKTEWFYNPRGELIEETRGSSRKTYRYDILGRKAAETEWYGGGLCDEMTTVWEYDLLNRPISEKKLDGAGRLLNERQTEYNLQGYPVRTLARTDLGVVEVRRTYDLMGRVTEEVDPLGQKTVTRWAQVESPEDPGQICLQKKIWDEADRIIQIFYDNQDNPFLEEIRSPSGALLSQFKRVFDFSGNKIVERQVVLREGQVNREPLTCWRYDKYGHLILLTEGWMSPDQKATHYLYDQLGQLQKVVKPSGAVVRYSYDVLGRLISQEGEGFSYAYVYDRIGKVLTAGGTSRTYDANDNVIQETFEHGIPISFSYDGLGRCVCEALHDGSAVRYEYEAFLNRVDRVGKGGVIDYSHEYLAYNQFGMPTHARHIQGGDILFSYDRLGRCTETRSHAYYEILTDFDPLGNLLSRMTQDSAQLEHRYTYDLLSQLRSESGTQVHTYSHDSLHNRHLSDQKEWRYNALNQLLSDESHDYSYDRDGRLEKIKGPDETVYLAYDGLDRLIQIHSGTHTVRFTYDAYNRRMSKEVSELRDGDWQVISKLYFIYQGKNEIGACDGEGKIVEFRALGVGLGAEIGAAIAIEIGDEVYAPIHDHRGSVVGLVRDNQVAEYYRYTAFGECEIRDGAHRLHATSPLGNPYQFSSKRIDEEMGLVYFGERYYLPTMGRWLTQDPLSYVDGPNLYAFVCANPLLHLDLWGLSKKKKWVIRGLVTVTAFIATAVAVHHYNDVQLGSVTLCL